MYDVDTGVKRLSVFDLTDALYDLPHEWLLEVNAVGNVMITNEDKEYMGYIDFNTGEVVLNSQD